MRAPFGRRVLFVTLLAGGCTPFGASPPLDADASAADAQAEETTAADAAAPDGGRDGAATPCAGGHLFCEDFDGPEPWSQWIVRKEAPDTVIGADKASFVSPPASLRIAVQPRPSNHPTYLGAMFLAAQRIVARATLRVSLESSPTGEIDVLALELVPPSGFTRYYAAIVATSSSRLVLETVMDSETARADLGAIGADFEEVSIDLDLTKGRIAAMRGNGTGVEGEVSTAVGKGYELKVGAPWANNSSGVFVVNVDDVTVDHP